MKESLDNETQKVLKEGENWSLFVEGEMWKECRRILNESLLAVESIHTLEETEENIFNEIKARKLATKIVNDWIGEIEGKADQYNMNKGSTVQGDEIIKHLD